ncbi:pilus assembly protein [Lysobacter brunescens]|uniref:Pilus assembly protein n=1 Tax=Lysobacter brunescens TaxID=262323 RepID=A0ABW2YFZ3_9GAMM
MTSRTHTSRVRRSTSATKWLTPLFACMATLLGLPVHAGITLPDTPMQANNGVPPNIWFILDDSGSMAWRYMYNPTISSLVRDGGNVVADATGDNRTKDSDYGSNSTALDAMYDQNYITNTLYYNPNQTYRGWQRADGTYMADESYDSVSTSNTHLTGTSNLNGQVQTFYVPPTTGALNDARLYTRYTFLTNGSAQRCTWNATNRNFSTTGNCTTVTSFTWPSGVTRNVAQEKINFANWYTYHRTRTKVAKAGVSYAFNDTSIFNADNAYRVGFTTIWQRDEYRIPVGTDNGLFRNANRNTWFDRLFDATASNGTPLKAALIRAGQYYEETGTGGPWGPQATTSQYECRQNFTILTTDGFWNTEGQAPVAAMGNADGSNGTAISRPDGPPYTYTAAAPFSDAWNNTLADVAMHYWKRDLRTDLTNTVPSSVSNPAFWQHMVTFGISIGLRGTLDVESTMTRVRNNQSVAWPNPNDSEDAERIDDLFHAAVNGRGAFVSAGNPDQFVDGLGSALRAIASRRGTGSNASVAGSSTTAGVKVFIARYFTGKWYGELSAYPVTNAGVGNVASWNATIPTWTTRRIFTHNGTTGATFPTSTQQGVLTPAIADYIRGDRSREEVINVGGTLRNRQSLLGDIVNSSPVYVKTSTTVDTVYIGANDGMLHAFDASTGVERFAYVPNGQDFNKLKEYADPSYNHKFYVDGPLVASTKRHFASQTVLVGSLGRGGRGLYALDITNPVTFDQTKVLWEKTGATEANLGQVLGAPFITRLNDGSVGLVVANGINSSSDKAVLFVFDVRTGAKLAEIEAPAGGTGPNGLSAPNGWDENGDGTVDYVYAGDLRGNVWKFDLSNSNNNQWRVANNRPLYAPTSGFTQPITGGVTISFDPVSEDRWVFFGTGRLLTTNDLLDDTLQTWYGIKDSDSNTGSLRRTDLTSRNIALYDEATKRRAFEPNAALPANSKGWYVDLDLPPGNTREGERMIGEPQIIRDVLVASSVIPNTSNPCTPGRGYLNAIDAYTGTSIRAGFFDTNFDGNFSNDLLGGGPGTGTFVGSFDPGVGLLTDPVCVDGQCIVNGALGPASVPVPQGYFSGRISWREIVRN